MPWSELELKAAASRLCLACGMCCNGVLFQIVRLQPEDSVDALEKRGMKLNRKKKEPYFNQPCRFLQECTCKIYAHRPSRCRQFECRQIAALAAEKTSEMEVAAVIESIHAQVRRVTEILSEMEASETHQDTAPDAPLMDRCRAVLRESELADFEDLDREARLLNTLLNQHLRLQPVVISDDWK